MEAVWFPRLLAFFVAVTALATTAVFTVPADGAAHLSLYWLLAFPHLPLAALLLLRRDVRRDPLNPARRVAIFALLLAGSLWSVGFLQI